MSRAMWRMLQHQEPDDFVLATGRTQTVQEFADLVFSQLGLNPADHIEIDPRYFRPARSICCWVMRPKPRRSWDGWQRHRWKNWPD